MKLLIIRHGDPDYVHDTLTERGWREAELLSERLVKEERINAVYVSPLGRAQATAAPFLEKSGLTAETREFLREFPCNAHVPLGEEGFAAEDKVRCCWDLDLAYFEKHAALLTDNEHWMEHKMYHAEKVGERAAFVGEELDRLLAENGLRRENYHYVPTGAFSDDELKNRTVALFCHMGLGSLLLAHIAHIAPPLFWQEYRFMPTAVSTVLFVPNDDRNYRSKIFAIGDTTHLPPIGLSYRW